MNWFEKIRDNLIPIEKLYNKFFYTDKVASLLLKLPISEVGDETALVQFLSKGFSKYDLLKLYRKQQKYELYINKAMAKFRVYDSNTRKYIQLIRIQYGQGIEYLLLGEILERDYKFNFKFTPQQIAEDNGYLLCTQIEQALNRMPDYFKDKDKNTLRAIRKMIKEEQILKKLENDE